MKPKKEEVTVLVSAGYSHVTRQIVTITCSRCKEHFYSGDGRQVVACPFCGRRTEEYSSPEEE